ncbi:MAG: sigma-54-dependent Fis family transcriptional regulator [Flavobacteriales bacterium]|jgi:transcriptional regulator with PAS, ATPase and Fis domain|nr:sigma-54-dependent Fis family transcriptional regulator [Flavobacteriales bacterium]
MNLQTVKNRFGIIGNSDALNRALDVAVQVAPTDITVLITGESGTGKENMPKIIHNYSSRKHHEYIAVNCGAIPEGTIDSELFGHEKGAFTGATDNRKGYFEVADGGTIFLDEVAELPLPTQVRLLRVLETGEFIKVGASKVKKTDVRIIAATNENVQSAIKKGKFREDLFYRLSTVPIFLEPLRERKDDIHLLFRKFSSDFAEKYRMPGIRLDQEAVKILEKYLWPGNIRQLKNVAEQISVIEKSRSVNKLILSKYLPDIDSDRNLPMVIDGKKESDHFSERDILYKVLFEMKQDVIEMKRVIVDLLNNNNLSNNEKTALITKLSSVSNDEKQSFQSEVGQTIDYSEKVENSESPSYNISFQESVEIEESLSLEEREKELIQKALKKHNGRRKNAAKELGISERTLYRKIKEFEILK